MNNLKALARNLSKTSKQGLKLWKDIDAFVSVSSNLLAKAEDLDEEVLEAILDSSDTVDFDEARTYLYELLDTLDGLDSVIEFIDAIQGVCDNYEEYMAE